MKKKQQTVQATVGAPPLKVRRLTWREERFIEYYIDTGNATLAAKMAGYPCPKQQGCRLLTRDYIQEAIGLKQQELRALLNFDREKAIHILLGMATAVIDDFSPVCDDPAERKNYRNLGNKRYAVQSVRRITTRQKDGSETITGEVTIISPSERRAVVNDLWEKLGLDKGASEQDRVSFLGRLAQLSSKLGRGNPEGENSGGQEPSDSGSQ